MTHLDLHLYTFTSISQLKCISEIHNIQKNLTMATECSVCMEQFEPVADPGFSRGGGVNPPGGA